MAFHFQDARLDPIAAANPTPRLTVLVQGIMQCKVSGLMDDFFDNWTVQVRKGLLELCILNALSEEERYGYDLVKTLVEVHGLGVTEGTIYPLLSRLRVAGLISSRLEESSSGPARKYYSLTKEGRKAMETMNDYMTELNRSVNRLRKKGA